MAFIVLKDTYPKLFEEINKFLLPANNYMIIHIRLCRPSIPYIFYDEFPIYWATITISRNQTNSPISQRYNRYATKYCAVTCKRKIIVIIP